MSKHELMKRAHSIPASGVYDWLVRCNAGDVLLYHTGMLARDRDGRPALGRCAAGLLKLSSAHRVEKTQGYVSLSDAMRTGTSDLVLFQHRLAQDCYNYYALVKRRPELGDLRRAFKHMGPPTHEAIRKPDTERKDD